MFVERDAFGKIKGRYSNRQPGYAEEYLPDDSIELLPTVAELEATRIVSIKQAATGVIEARYASQTNTTSIPLQSNMMARDTELKSIEAGTYYDGAGVKAAARALIASEITELANNSKALTWIKAVRAESNAAQAIANKQASAIVWPVHP